jgi:enoyl-CoA hydratase
MIELESSEGAPTLLRLARPPVNALDRSLVETITDAVAQAIDRRAPAIVLTGQGSCFSAGIDTKLAGRATRDEQIASILAINAMVHAIYSAPIPVVAAINGHALGGGLVMALACDVRVASRGAHKLGLNEVAAGVPFPAGPLRVVSAELDPSVLRDLCLTGRIVEADEARELRLVDELVEPAELLGRGLEVARQLASYEAYAVVKGQLRSMVAAELGQIVATGEDPMLAGWLRA